MAGTNTLAISEYLDWDGTSANGWNWKEEFVQKDENLGTTGDFVASESTLIAAGPARTSDVLKVVKVGLAPSIQISQQIPQQRLYEIGSVRCHILNGIPVGGLSINRMLYHGPSMMRTFYGLLYDDAGNPTDYGKTGMITQDNTAQTSAVSAWDSMTATPDRVMDGHGKDTHLWLSMWDQRFKLPFGLAIYMQDIKGNAVGGLYFEGCKVNSHQFGQSAGQMIMLEGLNVAFDRAVPIQGVGKTVTF